MELGLLLWLPARAARKAGCAGHREGGDSRKEGEQRAEIRGAGRAEQGRGRLQVTDGVRCDSLGKVLLLRLRGGGRHTPLR